MDSKRTFFLLILCLANSHKSDAVGAGETCQLYDGFGSTGYCTNPATGNPACFFQTFPSRDCDAGLSCCALKLDNIPTPPGNTLPPGGTTQLPPGGTTTLPPGGTTTQNPFGTTLIPPPPGTRVCGRLLTRSNSVFDDDVGDGPFAVAVGDRDRKGMRGGSRDRMKRIVGGDAVPNNDYCYQVAIVSSSNAVVATGVLISEDYVLTSYSGISRVDSTGRTLKLFLGGPSSIIPMILAGATSYSVVRVVRHPNFNANFGIGFPANDVALIQINKGAGLDWTQVCTICLTALPVVQTDCRRILVSGYGSTSEVSTISDGILRRVAVNLVPKPVCENVYKGLFGQRFALDQNAICAGGELGRDTCNRDGGAPLTCHNFNGDRYLLGTSSWGYGCGRAGYPSVYVNITPVMSWIRSIVPA